MAKKIEMKDMSSYLQGKLKEIVAEIESKENMQEIANYLKQDIYKRTKLGYGVDKAGGTQSKFRALSDGYKKQRKGMDDLASDTSPAKSNLTQTGDMLDALVATASKAKATVDIVDPVELEKAKWNEDNGRTFMNVSKSQILKITADIKAKVKKFTEKI